MDYGTLTAVGTIGFLVLIASSAVRECRNGHAVPALVGFLILSILSVDLWAVAPLQIEQKFSRGVTLWLLWPVAILPCVIILYRSIRRR